MCELLGRARTYIAAEHEVWVKLDRTEEVGVAKMCWQDATLATVWVQEGSEVFQGSILSDVRQVQGADARGRLEARVRAAMDGMHEESRAQLVQIRVGWDEGDTEFPMLCGPGDLLAALNLPTRHVGDIMAIPAADGGQRVYMGPQLYPMYEYARFPVMVRLNVGPNWQAQLEASRVLHAFMEPGATAAQQEAWGLLCSRNFLYLGPVRKPARRFTVVVFELDDLELGREAPPREGR